ncbi:transposase [Candidatus Woesearchaeota archaeon]|nr:transposase [Candidatus Woesearchaeota archaeon]
MEELIQHIPPGQFRIIRHYGKYSRKKSKKEI